MIYRTVGPTAGGAGRTQAGEMIPDLVSTISSIKNLRKFSQVAADSAKPAAPGGLIPVFILLKKTPGKRCFMSSLGTIVQHSPFPMVANVVQSNSADSDMYQVGSPTAKTLEEQISCVTCLRPLQFGVSLHWCRAHSCTVEYSLLI